MERPGPTTPIAFRFCEISHSHVSPLVRTMPVIGGFEEIDCWPRPCADSAFGLVFQNSIRIPNRDGQFKIIAHPERISAVYRKTNKEVVMLEITVKQTISLGVFRGSCRINRFPAAETGNAGRSGLSSLGGREEGVCS